MRITRGSDEAIQPKVVDTGTAQVNAELREIRPAAVYDLLVRAEPPWSPGGIRANVRLETGVEQSPMENVIVTANVVPRVQANPTRFVLKSNAAKDERITARLIWDDDQPSRIAATTVTDPALSATLQEQNGQEIVALDIPAGYVFPKGQAVQVMIEIDDPAMPLLQIPVQSMNVRPAAARSGQPAVRKGRPVYQSPATPRRPSAGH